MTKRTRASVLAAHHGQALAPAKEQSVTMVKIMLSWQIIVSWARRGFDADTQARKRAIMIIFQPNTGAATETLRHE